MSEQDHELAAKIEARDMEPVLTDRDVSLLIGDFELAYKVGQRMTLPNGARYERVWRDRWERI